MRILRACVAPFVQGTGTADRADRFTPESGPLNPM